MVKKGFTLIELMIVIAILGTLASIGVPKFGNMIRKAKESQTKGNLGAYRTATSIYYADNEGMFPDYVAINPGSPNWYSDDPDNYGDAWELESGFANYIDKLLPVLIGPEDGHSVTDLRRQYIYHQQASWPNLSPNPGTNDVGWWYRRTMGTYHCNVSGTDLSGNPISSW